MKICFTNAVADNKDEAAELLRKKTPWYSDNGDYERLIELYRSGRSINIIDTGFSDTVIIDCDDLSEKQIKLLADEKELKRIAREMVAEKITVLPSASRVESKRKIFIKKAYKREIVDNIDTAYREIRLQFFGKTGIACDSCMDTYTQITFGSKEIDLNVDVSNLTKISQPAKERKFVKKTMIPVSQWEINKVHGKHKYLMPRLEWNTSHYDPRKKAFITNWIKKGSRHRTLRKDN